MASNAAAIVVLTIGISSFIGRGRVGFIPVLVMSMLLLLNFWALFNKLGVG